MSKDKKNKEANLHAHVVAARQMLIVLEGGGGIRKSITRWGKQTVVVEGGVGVGKREIFSPYRQRAAMA